MHNADPLSRIRSIKPILNFAQRSKRQRLPAGTVLASQNTNAEWVHYIENGVVVETETNQRGETGIRRIIVAGTLAGAISTLLQSPNAVSIIALSDLFVWSMTASHFRSLHESDLQIVQWTSILFAKELRRTAEEEVIIRLSTPRMVTEEFVKYLQREFAPHLRGVLLLQEQVAQWLNLSFERYWYLLQLETKGVFFRPLASNSLSVPAFTSSIKLVIVSN